MIRLNWENCKTTILLKVIETMIEAMGGALPLYIHSCKTNKKYKIQVNQTDMLLKTKPKKLQNKRVLIRNEGKSCNKNEIVPDVFSLLSLPKPLRLTALALYKIDKATAQDIAKETNRSVALENACANQLVKLNYIKERKRKPESILLH